MLWSWLPDDHSQNFRSYVFGPSGFWTMAPLRYVAKFDPFLSLDCAPTPSTLAQCKERKGSNFAIWQHRLCSLLWTQFIYQQSHLKTYFLMCGEQWTINHPRTMRIEKTIEIDFAAAPYSLEWHSLPPLSPISSHHTAGILKGSFTQSLGFGRFRSVFLLQISTWKKFIGRVRVRSSRPRRCGTWGETPTAPRSRCRCVTGRSHRTYKYPHISTIPSYAPTRCAWTERTCPMNFFQVTLLLVCIIIRFKRCR